MKNNKERPTIIIEIEGGCLKAVSSTIPIFYYLVDRDNIGAGDEFPEGTDYMENDVLIGLDKSTSVVDYLKSLK